MKDLLQDESAVLRRTCYIVRVLFHGPVTWWERCSVKVLLFDVNAILWRTYYMMRVLFCEGPATWWECCSMKDLLRSEFVNMSCLCHSYNMYYHYLICGWLLSSQKMPKEGEKTMKQSRVHVLQRSWTYDEYDDWNIHISIVWFDKWLSYSCLGHAGIKGDERAESLTSKATMLDVIALDHADILNDIGASDQNKFFCQWDRYYIFNETTRTGSDMGWCEEWMLYWEETKSSQLTQDWNCHHHVLTKMLKSRSQHLWTCSMCN